MKQDQGKQGQNYSAVCAFDELNRTMWKVTGDDSFRVAASSEQVARQVADALNLNVFLKQSLAEAQEKLLTLQRENMRLKFELSGTYGPTGEPLIDEAKKVF